MKKFAACFLILILCSFLSVSFAETPSCPFCNPGIIEKQNVFEDQYFRVLTDSAPVIKGHLLVVPKRHITKAHELLSEEWAELATIIPKIVKVFQHSFDTDQYLILEKNGPVAGQSVPHIHFHLIPVQSPASADQINTVLLAKVFQVRPKKLSEKEIELDVAEFRQWLNLETAIGAWQ